MSVEHFELLVEEPSMEAFLRMILPKILGEITFEIYPHQCKEELLNRLPQRLKGYKAWLPKNWRIVIIVDKDDDDCIKLKSNLEEMATKAGLSTRSKASSQGYSVVNRVVVEELEAWYFGDWYAVRKAYPNVPNGVPLKAKYRDPDKIAGETWEAFERVLKKAGYFDGGLRKIEAARHIGEHMNVDRNTSRSFQVFRDCLRVAF